MQRFCQGIIFTLIFSTAPFVSAGRAQIAPGNVADNVYWICFKDKVGAPSVIISERALERRRIRSSRRSEWYDTPISEEYIRRLEEEGAVIRNRSRWLNAVSAALDPAEIEKIERLPFVTKISKVSSYSWPLPISEGEGGYYPPRISAFDYGPSYAQIGILNIDSLHNLGLSGNGVLIGVLDTGFDTSHTVFSDIRFEGRILATYDFINGDPNVVDGPDAQRTHGTQVLSALAGFAEGSLIGPAYGADFILAKTEIVSTEIQAEEDNWVAAAEWMESLGVDIISSSLGYIDWYDTSQADGQTPLVTQAANIAISLGVVVVNAAGNEGNTSWRIIIPPADGDSVMAVGAVDLAGTIVDFSSRGPTADGRIKPDFCALGLSVYLANWAGGYGYSGGTSFATPLIAGGVALLLEGHPGWSVADLFRVLKRSSSNRVLPNNTYGWGIPDFTAAFYDEPGAASLNGSTILIAPHPAVDSAMIYLDLRASESGELSIHDLSGTLVNRFDLSNDQGGVTVLVWDGRNSAGKRVASGIYLCQFVSGNREAVEKFFFVRQN